MKCFLCGEKAKKKPFAYDPCGGYGDTLYRCEACDIEWFSETKKRKPPNA